AAELIYDLIAEIIASDPIPIPQEGMPVHFDRRRPEESVLPCEGADSSLYDFIRMLDAPSYPKAFVEWGEWRIEFDHAQLTSDEEVSARVVLRKNKTAVASPRGPGGVSVLKSTAFAK